MTAGTPDTSTTPNALPAILASRPATAKALIVAQLREDESDPLTDYFHSRTVRAVALGWRTTNRESFPQMRKAAATFGPTAHLGPGRDLWTLTLVWDHDSRDEAARARAFMQTQEHYDEGWNVRTSAIETPDALATESEADAWLAEHAAPAGTRWEKHCESFEHREKYSMGGGFYLMDGWHRRGGWMVSAYPLREDGSLSWSGVALEDAIGSADLQDGEPATHQAKRVGRARVEPHTHTKRGFTMWLVIPADRLDRATFEALRDAAQAAGGWYSRRWGKTPGGFAFKAEDTAGTFARDHFGEGDDPTPEGPEPTGRDTAPTPSADEKTAAKLDKLADGLQKQIEDKRRPMTQNPTPKRMREYRSRLHDADNLERGQRALRVLAAAHRRGDAPAPLIGLTTKKGIMPLVAKGLESGGYYDVIPSNDYRRDDAQAVALQALLESSASDEQRADEEAKGRADRLARLEDDVRFARIPGYFRTPDAVIDRMLERVDLRPGMRVLEPSAGDGAIVDRIRELHGEWIAGQVDACERNPQLRDILDLKGYAAILDGDDFLSLDLGPAYDVVLMNPPFEKGQDIDHVRHAFDCLKPGGRLVGIMSPGSFFRQDRKPAAFQEWFGALNGERENLPRGAFRVSGTDVATVMAILDKPRG